MVTEAERIARLEVRADSMDRDSVEQWRAMEAMQEIRVTLARVLEKLDAGAINFKKIDGDLESVSAKLDCVDKSIPKNLEDRLKALENAQTATGFKVALIWSGSVALAALVVSLAKDWAVAHWWK